MTDFEKIYTENTDFIYKYLLKLCGNSSVAEELTQEVMLQIFSAIRKNNLAKLAEFGFVKVQGNKAISQFVIATKEQYERIKKEVFEPIAQKLQTGYEVLREELTKFYRAKLPRQLKEISKLPLRQALYDMGYVTTVIAFRDGKLYVPQNSADGEFLTMAYVK